MYLRLELIYQHYLTNMKDQHNHKITEHEFTKDIRHWTEDKKFGLCKECNTMKNLPVGELCGRCYFDLPVNKNNMTIYLNIRHGLKKETKENMKNKAKEMGVNLGELLNQTFK